MFHFLPVPYFSNMKHKWITSLHLEGAEYGSCILVNPTVTLAHITNTHVRFVVYSQRLKASSSGRSFVMPMMSQILIMIERYTRHLLMKMRLTQSTDSVSLSA